MTNFVSVIGILFCLHFVSFPCRGAISIVNGGDVRYAVPGENVTIEWSLGTAPSNALIRVWTFISTRETIARIIDNRKEEIPTSSLGGVKVEKPVTLILNNVNESYNGTYRFQFADNSGLQQTSFVSLFIAAKAAVTINCSSSTTVDEGSDVRCLCKAEGGNPPANVTWYDKDNKPIDVAGNEEKMLTLSNIDKTASGAYRCVAQSYTLKNEESIDIFVHYPPEKPVFFAIPKIVEVGKAVVMICCANALPAPSVTIILKSSVLTTIIYSLMLWSTNTLDHTNVLQKID